MIPVRDVQHPLLNHKLSLGKAYPSLPQEGWMSSSSSMWSVVRFLHPHFLVLDLTMYTSTYSSYISEVSLSPSSHPYNAGYTSQYSSYLPVVGGLRTLQPGVSSTVNTLGPYYGGSYLLPASGETYRLQDTRASPHQPDPAAFLDVKTAPTTFQITGFQPGPPSPPRGRTQASPFRIPTASTATATGLSAGAPSLQPYGGTNLKKRKKLQEIKICVLDNSLRESTVGQTRGHTPNDKYEILGWAKKCGFRNLIVASFGPTRRVDDAFCEHLAAQGEDVCDLWTFTDDADTTKDGMMMFGEDHIPIALAKTKKYGLKNCIIEIDLNDKSVDWNRRFSPEKLMELLTFLLQWMKSNLSPQSKAMVNLRDFPLAMVGCPERVKYVVGALARLPLAIRPIGLLIEEPMGEYLPDEVGAWVASVRATMDSNGWASRFQTPENEMNGVLLTHVHKQWGMADAVVIECLVNGCDGIWCSVAEEGAAQGHACSAVTLANLARLGNRDVLTRYNCKELAAAARAVTHLTTEKPVHDRQVVYGPRAIEAVFGFGGIAGGASAAADVDGDGDVDDMDAFSLAKFLGVEDPPIRLTSLASPDLWIKRLKQCFGQADAHLFTLDAVAKLQDQERQNLENEIDFEYTSPRGLAMLWSLAFGSTPRSMMQVLDSEPNVLADKLLSQAEKVFKDLAESDNKDPSLTFEAFYHAYLQPYFGCFTCERTRFALDALDLDDDGGVAWSEWRFWCQWALNNFAGDITTLDELHASILRSAILPVSLQKERATKTVDHFRSTVSLDHDRYIARICPQTRDSAGGTHAGPAAYRCAQSHARFALRPLLARTRWHLRDQGGRLRALPRCMGPTASPNSQDSARCP